MPPGVHPVLEATVPVFAVVALGYALARWRQPDPRTLGYLAMSVTSPALVFSLFSEIDLDAQRWGIIAGGALWIIAGSGLVGWLIVRGDPVRRRAVLLPALLWNAGNLGLPLSRLAFGERGLAIAVIVFVTIVIVQSTFGIWLAKGRGGGVELLRQPLFHATWAGIAVTATGAPVPTLVAEPVRLLADMAIPLMLLNLGIQLHTLRAAEMRGAGLAVLVRMGGGFASAFFFVRLFDCPAEIAQVLYLAGVLPPAVINVVFAERFATRPALVASAIVLGTLVSVVTIPLVLWFVI